MHVPKRFETALTGLEVLAWAAVDLNAEGAFADALVALTPTELVRVEHRDGAPLVTGRWELAGLGELDTRERDGWLALVAAGPPRRELARATVAQLEPVAALRERTVRWRDEGVRPDDKPAGSDRCPQCGRRRVDGRCPHCRPWHRTVRRLAEVVRPHLGALTGAAALMFAGAALSLAPPYLVKVLMDDVLKTGAGSGPLVAIVAAMAVAMTLNQLISYGQRIVDSRLGGVLAHRLRIEGFEALARFSLTEVGRTTSGGLTNTLLRDVDQLIELVTNQGFAVAWHALMITGVIGMLGLMDPWLTLGILTPTPIIVWTVYRISLRGRRIVTRLWAEWRHLADTLHDVVDGFRVVKAFHAEPQELARLVEASEGNRRWELEQSLHYGRHGPALAAMTGLATVIVWAWGGWQVIHGRQTVGTLVAYVSYLGMLYANVQGMAQLAAAIPRMMISSERYFELIDTVPVVRPPERPVVLAAPRGRIVLSRVCFAYTPGRQVVHDVDLTIEPGEMIGLVGKSGAGKSTLINLIARFYDPTRGTVTLDGVDLRELDPDALRRHVGVVLQTPFLFDGTILDNLRLARPDATPLEIARAADRAQAHDVIMALPDAYDTRLGTGGHELSAGERQRMTIARALLADPKVLILDEATASVDTQTEKRIQDALAELVTGRTTIAIAHRLSTLGRADRLVVMEGGRIVDSGTHKELTDRPGLYRDLVTAQEEMMRVQRMRGEGAPAPAPAAKEAAG